jgi:hypothetical protein
MGFAHFCFPLPTLREDAPQWGAVIPPRNAPTINKRRFASQRQKPLTLTLTEYAGFSPAYIYEAEGFV